MTTCIVVHDDMSVTKMDVEYEEIPDMLDSGYFSAVLKIVDGEIMYASIDWGNYEFSGWKIPEADE